MSHIIYKAMVVSDLGAVEQLMQTIAEISVRDYESGAVIASAVASNYPNSRVAVHDGVIVGAVFLLNNGLRGEVLHLCIHPSLRLQGIGSALLCDALRSFKATTSVTRIFARVARGNTAGKVLIGVGFRMSSTEGGAITAYTIDI